MISFPSSYLFCIRLPIKSSHLVIIFQFISWCCHKMENIPTLLLLMLLHFCFSNAKIGSHEVIDNPSPVSAMFAFGDMMIETGNNNFLNSIAKSNFWPYGCDFNRGPTGRFTNGKTIVDLLGNLTFNCIIISCFLHKSYPNILADLNIVGSIFIK